MRATFLFLIVLLALPANAGRTPIETAIIEGEEDEFYALLMRFMDAQANRAPHPVLTSLVHLAVAFNRPVMIRMFHKAGYSLNVANERGMTPLDVAYVMGHWEVTRVLQNLGATFGTRRVEQVLRPPNANLPAEEIQAPPPAIVIRGVPGQHQTDRRHATRPPIDSFCSIGFFRRW